MLPESRPSDLGALTPRTPQQAVGQQGPEPQAPAARSGLLGSLSSSFMSASLPSLLPTASITSFCSAQTCFLPSDLLHFLTVTCPGVQCLLVNPFPCAPHLSVPRLCSWTLALWGPFHSALLWSLSSLPPDPGLRGLPTPPDCPGSPRHSGDRHSGEPEAAPCTLGLSGLEKAGGEHGPRDPPSLPRAEGPRPLLFPDAEVRLACLSAPHVSPVEKPPAAKKKSRDFRNHPTSGNSSCSTCANQR